MLLWTAEFAFGGESPNGVYNTVPNGILENPHCILNNSSIILKTMPARLRTRLIILVSVFLLLTLYTIIWTRTVLDPMLDFRIYYDAAAKLLRGESAYFPYEVGKSFLYHPSVLSVLSILARLPFETAYAVWSVFSAFSYGLAVWLAMRLSTQSIRTRRTRSFTIGVIVMFALFAPLIENLYVGQINTFVALCLVLGWLCAEREDRLGYIGAGIALAIAIILKTTPVLLIGYFIATRRYRVVAAAIAAFAALSALPLVQFGASLYTDFVSVSLNITGGRVILGDYYNFSAAAVTYRILSALGFAVSDTLTIWVWRGIFGAIFALILLRAWRTNLSGEARQFLYAACIVILTVISPLVWIHHGVLLLLPLMLVIRRYFFVGAMIMVLMQVERLLYNWISITVGTALISALPIALALTAGTATLIGQLWLLSRCWRSASSE
jgi:hypothetical protein